VSGWASGSGPLLASEDRSAGSAPASSSTPMRQR
jgi:hypothetical protein